MVRIHREPPIYFRLFLYMFPSSRGLGHLPFTEDTGVRIPLGTPFFENTKGSIARWDLFYFHNWLCKWFELKRPAQKNTIENPASERERATGVRSTTQEASSRRTKCGRKATEGHDGPSPSPWEPEFPQAWKSNELIFCLNYFCTEFDKNWIRQSYTMMDNFLVIMISSPCASG